MSMKIDGETAKQFSARLIREARQGMKMRDQLMRDLGMSEADANAQVWPESPNEYGIEVTKKDPSEPLISKPSPEK